VVLRLNINQNINKLLYALKQKGKIYRINSFQFYNEKLDKYSTKYQILKRELIEKEIEVFYKEDGDYYIPEDEIEYEEKYSVDHECYSKVEIMKYLAEEYRKGSEASGG